MDYCGPRGIALDAFLRWSRRSQDAALEWSAYESRRCRGCGTHPEDWESDKRAHHAHLTQCPGCREAQRLGESDSAKSERGVRVVLAPGSGAGCSCQPDDD